MSEEKRVIKFRVWDKKRKQWETFPHDRCGYEDLCLMDYLDREGEYEVMQYTGLKDKNGKEIYEGDIVEHMHHGIGIVKWRERNACFIVSGKKREYLFDDDEGAYIQRKVIGNIWENSELLTPHKGE